LKTALYTTIYPFAQPFLEEWKHSVLNQQNQDFDVWVGVDGFSLSESKKLLQGLDCEKIIINDRPNLKAYIRKKVLAEIAEQYDAVILVDSDDLLSCSRVANAKEQLSHYDVTGCAMQLIDVTGKDLGISFGRHYSDFRLENIIQFNQYGLSNTAYRCQILKKCLHSPDECQLFDWFLITNAWSVGANIYFDPVERMSYRQYPNNTTKILMPFDNQDINYATECVLQHFSFLLENSKVLRKNNREIIQARKNSVDKFYNRFLNDQHFSKQYLHDYNELCQDKLWWSCVANPKLEALWNP